MVSVSRAKRAEAGVIILMVGLYGVLYLLAIATRDSKVFVGITIDLLVSLPLIYYFASRRQNVPLWRIWPWVTLGFILGSMMIPGEHQSLLRLARTWLMPVAELLVVIFIVRNVRAVLAQDRSHTGRDFLDRIRKIAQNIFPLKAVANAMATEIAVFYYALFSWRYFCDGGDIFSYHKRSSTRVLYFFLIGVAVVETAIFHLLVRRWSETGAWILTGLSLYFILQIIAHLKAMRTRPIELGDVLYIRHGLLGELTVPFNQIERVEPGDQACSGPDKKVLTLSFFKSLEEVNVTLFLHEEATLTGIYGLKRKGQVVRLFIDRDEEFRIQLLKRLVRSDAESV